jgi:hypothetical protein
MNVVGTVMENPTASNRTRAFPHACGNGQVIAGVRRKSANYSSCAGINLGSSRSRR